MLFAAAALVSGSACSAPPAAPSAEEAPPPAFGLEQAIERASAAHLKLDEIERELQKRPDESTRCYLLDIRDYHLSLMGESLRVAEKEAPNDVRVMLLRAAWHFWRGEYEKALETNRRVLKVESGSRKARYNAALCLKRLGRLEEAKAECEAVLRLDPTHRAAQRLLIRVERLLARRKP